MSADRTKSKRSRAKPEVLRSGSLPSRSDAARVTSSHRSFDLMAAEDLHRALLGASTFFEKALQDTFEDEGVTPSQFYLLRTLGASSTGALSPKILQQSFVRRRNLTETVHRIVRDGLVERIPNPEDGRSVLVALTDRGLEVLQRATVAYHSALSLLLTIPDANDALVTLDVLQELTDRLKSQVFPETAEDDS